MEAAMLAVSSASAKTPRDTSTSAAVWAPTDRVAQKQEGVGNTHRGGCEAGRRPRARGSM